MPASLEQVRALQEVQDRIDAIPYCDLQGRGEASDDWIDVPESGHSWVCRDYAIAKGRELRIVGFSPAQLSIVTCWTEPVFPPTDLADRTSGREYHAVLAVTFQDEVLVLDSRAALVYPAEHPPFPYLWDRQQIPGTVAARDARGGLI